MLVCTDDFLTYRDKRIGLELHKPVESFFSHCGFDFDFGFLGHDCLLVASANSWCATLRGTTTALKPP